MPIMRDITESVEGAGIEAALETLDTRQPQLLRYGVQDETAWDVGLACGGTIHVFVEPLEIESYYRLQDLLDRDELFALVTIVDGPPDLLARKIISLPGGSFSGSLLEEMDKTVLAKASAVLKAGESQRLRLEPRQTNLPAIDIFIEINKPAPQLVVIGGVHIAIALTAMAKAIGYRTIVIDPRRAFGSKNRFADVDQLIQTWPTEAFDQITLTSSTAIASLTHDPKIDDLALKIALDSPVFYVGALGSRKTHRKRRERLRSAGILEDRLNRIHGPIGLNIGAQSPEEIAVSIMAEIVAASHGVPIQ